jgi:rubrerythrin
MATQNTGASNVTYNLTSVLYHALQGAETYDDYIRDAERQNDNDLASFFREVQQEERERAQRAQKLRAERLLRSLGS